MVYSKKLDGGFWVIFARAVRGSSDLGTLVTRPLSTFNKATEILRKHNDNKYHKNAMTDMITFVQSMEHQRESVLTLANSAHSRQIEENRLKLTSVVKCLVFCGKQNIPLRGHRDDERWLGSSSHNPGNFRVESGDEVLKEHFRTCPRNATYRSKTIQNELIEIIGEQIREKILEEVKQARFFSILADEAAADVSNEEQLSLVLRFVDSSSQI